MKRHGHLVLGLAVAALLAIMLTGGASRAQDPVDQAAEGRSSAPLTEGEPGGEPIVWPGSDPVPEGVQLVSPPDSGAQVNEGDDGPSQALVSLRVAGSALKPRQSNVELTAGGGGGCLYASAGTAYSTFNTPLYLPQGATVKTMRLYYNDTNASANSYAWFTVYDLYGSIVHEYAVTSSGNTGNGFNDTPEFTLTVDYSLYAYMINWRPYDLGSDMQVCGFRIFYERPVGATYLPVVKDS